PLQTKECPHQCSTANVHCSYFQPHYKLKSVHISARQPMFTAHTSSHTASSRVSTSVLDSQCSLLILPATLQDKECPHQCSTANVHCSYFQPHCKLKSVHISARQSMFTAHTSSPTTS
ncbi:hypothetical protein RRG08_002888, partial [Elysia crispata]